MVTAVPRGDYLLHGPSLVQNLKPVYSTLLARRTTRQEQNPCRCSSADKSPSACFWVALSLLMAPFKSPKTEGISTDDKGGSILSCGYADRDSDHPLVDSHTNVPLDVQHKP